MSEQSAAPAGRQEHEREINAAIADGRLPDHETVRTSWATAFERDAAQARRDLAARPTGQHSAGAAGSLARAVGSIPGNNAATFGRRSEVRR